jgi:hypothetical protein
LPFELGHELSARRKVTILAASPHPCTWHYLSGSAGTAGNIEPRYAIAKSGLQTRDSADGLTHYQKLVIGLEIRGQFENRACPALDCVPLSFLHCDGDIALRKPTWYNLGVGVSDERPLPGNLIRM